MAKYSCELKKRVVHERLNGATPSSLSRKYNIPKKYVRTWVSAYRQNGYDALRIHEPEGLTPKKRGRKKLSILSNNVFSKSKQRNMDCNLNVTPENLESSLPMKVRLARLLPIYLIEDMKPQLLIKRLSPILPNSPIMRLILMGTERSISSI